MIDSKETLLDLTARFGVLPFFSNSIKGWSVEEHTAPEHWFTDAPGPWEWRGELACDRAIVYGKFIRGKAAFVSPDAFGELAALRRVDYTFDELNESGRVPRAERLIMDYVRAHPNELARSARRGCGVSKGFDTALTHLMGQTFVIYSDFRYSLDRYGRPYGWGNGALCTPEDWLGEDFMTAAEELDGPLHSLIQRIQRELPDADTRKLGQMLGAGSVV